MTIQMPIESECDDMLQTSMFTTNCTSGEHVRRVYEQYERFYILARFITGLIFYPIVCLFGLAGNALSIAVMSRKQMKSSTNVYLLVLSISDCIKLISDFLYFMVILLMHLDPPSGYKTYGFMYPYCHYIFNSSLCISAWLTVSVALERYIYVCHPTRVRWYCTVSRARAISAIVFFSMSVLAIPYAMRYKTVVRESNRTGPAQYDLTVTSMWENEVFAKTYTWIQNFLRSIIPLVILIILNTCIIYGLRRCRLGGRTNTGKKHRITIMLIFVIIVFLVCISPDAVMSTFLGLGYYEENFLARGIREVTDLLLLINSGVNFIIYCIFNTVFWKNFQSLFCSPCLGSRDLCEESQLRRLSLGGKISTRTNGHRRSCPGGALTTEL